MLPYDIFSPKPLPVTQSYKDCRHDPMEEYLKKEPMPTKTKKSVKEETSPVVVEDLDVYVEDASLILSFIGVEYKITDPESFLRMVNQAVQELR